MNTHDLTALENAFSLEAQTGATDDTKRVRVWHGIYSLRGQPGRYIIRIRIPAGLLTPGQLETIARLAEESKWPAGAHLTTRQGIEIAGVAAAEVVPFLQRLEAAGLTTLRTGGPVVRGVVCCPLSGVAADEVFDITPYALAADRYLREHAALQQLPRKIKISFEGCGHDHVRTLVSDMGVRAVEQGGRAGFRIVVGGGLGASPKTAFLLDPFVPRENLFPVLEAILRVFNRCGRRDDRARARLKWLLADWGIEKFREEVRTELAGADQAWQTCHEPLPEIVEWQPSDVTREGERKPIGEADVSQAWRQSNIQFQKQRGFAAVFIRCPLGDLLPAQLRRVAEAARRFAGGVRTSIDQNLVLRGVREESLPELYQFLRPANLAKAGIGQLPDITRCVGATACLSAITNPRPAAEAVAAAVAAELAGDPALRHLRIRISGCPNSCSHHHIADIGLFGVSKRINGRPVPHYAMLLGGADSGEAFGARAIEIPAIRLSRAVEQVLRLYRAQRGTEESFSAFISRVGLASVRNQLALLAQVPAPGIEPAAYRDLGADQDFPVGTRGGECAA
jgi:sulfite reductase beta subunit-like hemoprotein